MLLHFNKMTEADEILLWRQFKICSQAINKFRGKDYSAYLEDQMEIELKKLRDVLIKIYGDKRS